MAAHYYLSLAGFFLFEPRTDPNGIGKLNADLLLTEEWDEKVPVNTAAICNADLGGDNNATVIFAVLSWSR